MSAKSILSAEPENVETGASCVSCHAPLTGRYCSSCGEQALDPHSQTVRHFVSHSLLHEIAHVDGKTLLTLRKLLFRPAFLTLEYCAGRRRFYVNPLRLLITAIIIYALLTRGGLQVSLFLGPVTLSIAPAAISHGASVAETVTRIDRFQILGRALEEKQKTRQLESESARDKFHGQLERFAEPLSFANVVLLSLVLYVLFHRKRTLLVEHSVFSLHFLSFVLLSSLIFVPLPTLIARGWSVAAMIVLPGIIWQFTYLTVAIRKFYFPKDTRRFLSVLKAAGAACIIYVSNSAFITAVQLLGGWFALRSL